MPIYIYYRESTGEIAEVVQGMNDEHVYHGQDGAENDWKRVYTSPQASIDTKINPNDPKAFLEATRNKRGTYGDMQDLSKELSDKRAGTKGVDPVKEKFFENYSKERKGAKHPEELKKKRDFGPIKVDWDG